VWARISSSNRSRLGVIAALAALFSVACSEPEQDEAEILQSTPAPALRLQMLKPEVREIQENIVGTGTIGAKQTSNIGVVTPGIVESIYVLVGDQIKKGQPLFQTRPNDYEISVNLASAELEATEARAEQARLDFERAKDLLDKKFISQAQFDSTGNAQRAADAETGVSRARLAQAEQTLSDTIVRAPYDGVVTMRNVDEGTFKSTQSFSANSSVLQLQEISAVVAVVRVPETKLQNLVLGTPADLFIDGIDDVVPSDIWVINDKADMQSRTVEVRFALANDDYQIKPGLFVRAEIHPPARVAMLLRQDAILDRSGSPHVFVLDAGVASRRVLILREFNATSVEIVSGLDANDQVLIGPDLVRLEEGDQIRDVPDVAR
jgi:RND family efflux transporter MFP subunit